MKLAQKSLISQNSMKHRLERESASIFSIEYGGFHCVIRFRLSNFMNHIYDVINLHFPEGRQKEFMLPQI